MSWEEFSEPTPEDYNEKGELNFRYIWKSFKTRSLRNLKDLPEEAAIILETARTSMINLIKSAPCEVLTDSQKEEMIKVILEDKNKDEILENWWRQET